MATARPSCHLLQSALGPGHLLGFLEICSLWGETGGGAGWGSLLTLPLLLACPSSPHQAWQAGLPGWDMVVFGRGLFGTGSRVLVLKRPLTLCVALGRSLPLSVPPLPHL